MMRRDTFIFYRSFKESMKDLSDQDKLVMYEAISDYSLDLKEPDLTGFPKALFSLIRPILDANIQRWKNGRKGGAPVGNFNAKKTTEKQPKNNQEITEKQPKNNQETTEKQPNKDKDVNKDKDKNKDKNKEGAKDESFAACADKSCRFVPPSLLDIQNFIKEKGYSVNASSFIDFYTSKNWMIGKNKMKDWRAAVRTWQRRQEFQGAEVGVVLKDNSVDKYANDKLW